MRKAYLKKTPGHLHIFISDYEIIFLLAQNYFLIQNTSELKNDYYYTIIVFPDLQLFLLYIDLFNYTKSYNDWIR